MTQMDMMNTYYEAVMAQKTAEKTIEDLREKVITVLRKKGAATLKNGNQIVLKYRAGGFTYDKDLLQLLSKDQIIQVAKISSSLVKKAKLEDIAKPFAIEKESVAIIDCIIREENGSKIEVSDR